MTSNQGEPDDGIEAVKLVYGVTISDIREFKARQWDVTKWTIAVILALIIPHVVGKEKLSPIIVGSLFWIGVAFGIWSVWTILRLQWSLRGCRRTLETYREKWPALKALDGDPKWLDKSFWRDFDVWLLQISFITAALYVLALATREASLITVLMQQFD